LFRHEQTTRAELLGKKVLSALMVCAIALVVAGCQFWKSKEERKEFRLPPLPVSKNTVTLEVGIVEIDNSLLEPWETLWSKLDNQAVSVDQRRLLDLNGLRLAIIPAQPPLEFWSVIDPEIQYASEDERAYQEKLRQAHGKPQQKNLLSLKKVGILPGQSDRIETAPTLSTASWQIRLVSDLNQIVKKSGVVQLGQCKYRFNVIPKGNSTVLIRMTPEIHHGENKPRYDIANDNFIQSTQQDVMTFHELAIEIPVRVGQAVLCGPTASDDASLGQLFFRSRDRMQTRGIFIRVTGAKKDNLFAPSELDDDFSIDTF